MNNLVLSCQGLSKTYHDGELSVPVLAGVDLDIKAGEKIAIVGPSGSGKSTLLHLLGGLDKPTAGSVLSNGQDWQKLSEKQRCQFRNQRLGFVYQFHHLLPEFTALENVAMPLLLGKQSLTQAMQTASAMLEQVGLSARLAHKPAQLSGG